MPTCPKCRTYFRVLEDELPESHGCRKCGYMPTALENCQVCGKVLSDDEVAECYEIKCQALCSICLEEEV